jgi:hypothetical protein
MLQYNLACASFIGWTYITWQEANELKRGAPAGWYSTDPRKLNFNLKLHRPHWRGRSNLDLKFDRDWNWIQELNLTLQTKLDKSLAQSAPAWAHLAEPLQCAIGSGDLISTCKIIQEIVSLDIGTASGSTTL